MTAPGTRPRVAVSACLLGMTTRYDGASRDAGPAVDHLAEHVDVVPLCPEVEAGLGLVRPPIDLVEPAHRPDVRQHGTGARLGSGLRHVYTDLAARLVAWRVDLCVLKARSPSCGIEAVPLHGRHRPPRPLGRGLFVEVWRASAPLRPVVDERAFADRARWRAMVDSLFCLRRLRHLGPRLRRGALARFHRAHAVFVWAHRPGAETTLRRLAEAGVASAYGAALARVLASPPSPRSEALALVRLARSLEAPVASHALACARAVEASHLDFTRALERLARTARRYGCAWPALRVEAREVACRSALAGVVP